MERKLEGLESIIERLKATHNLEARISKPASIRADNLLDLDGKTVRFTDDETGFHINYDDWHGDAESIRLKIWETSLIKAGLLSYNLPLTQLHYKTIDRRKLITDIRAEEKSSHTYYFYGPSGTGKTSLAIAIGHQLAKDGSKVLAFRWREFLINIIDAYSDDSKSVLGVQEEATKVPILILDEFATRLDPTPSEKDTALGLISRREGMGLSTIITSNIPPANLPYGKAFQSRIQSSNHTFFGEEENYRLRK